MEAKSKFLVVSKLDAASRQMLTAIEIYFESGDPVSIHTLTAAAHEIIDALNVKAGGKPMMVRGQLLETVKPEYRNEVAKLMRQPQNYFKHAGKMPAEQIEFNPELSEWWLFDAGRGFQQVTRTLPDPVLAYRLWFMMHRVELALNANTRAKLAAVSAMLGAIDRRTFYVKIMEFAADPEIKPTLDALRQLPLAG